MGVYITLWKFACFCSCMPVFVHVFMESCLDMPALLLPTPPLSSRREDKQGAPAETPPAPQGDGPGGRAGCSASLEGLGSFARRTLESATFACFVGFLPLFVFSPFSANLRGTDVLFSSKAKLISANLRETCTSEHRKHFKHSACNFLPLRFVYSNSTKRSARLLTTQRKTRLEACFPAEFE